jgi:phytoene synthase
VEERVPMAAGAPGGGAASLSGAQADDHGATGGDARAQAILSRHARSFAFAARLLPRADRSRVARLYALCRTVDDLADEDGSADAACRLARIAAALADGGDHDPLVRDARALFSGRDVGLAAFGDLVHGVRGDLGRVEIADLDGLDAYAQAVAGSVGLMMASLFDVPRRFHAQAADLGKAMQLTNICRDVAEDAAKQRRYLPATLCPWSPGQIAVPTARVLADVRHAVAVLLARADDLYASGQGGLGALPPRVRLAVAVAAALYRGIHGVLRARDCDPMQGRVHVPALSKLRLAVGAGVGLIHGREPYRLST